jgi:hypothetical protein
MLLNLIEEKKYFIDLYFDQITKDHGTNSNDYLFELCNKLRKKMNNICIVKKINLSYFGNKNFNKIIGNILITIITKSSTWKDIIFGVLEMKSYIFKVCPSEVIQDFDLYYSLNLIDKNKKSIVSKCFLCFSKIDRILLKHKIH